MSRFDLEAGDPVATGVAVAPAGLSVLVVGPVASGNEALRRSLRHSLALAELVERVADAERLLPRCHFDCVVVEVGSATDPALAWIEANAGQFRQQWQMQVAGRRHARFALWG